jgi:FkbM family methyltransferase
LIRDLAIALEQLGRHPFNRGRFFPAAMRWLRWQFSSRLALGPLLVPFVGDMKLCMTSGMHAATGNIYTGLQEFDEMAFVLHFLRPDELFVDVGANIGCYSILAAAAGARVIAFEPAPPAFAQISLNVRLNDLGGRVEIRREAVGRAPGVVTLTTNQGTVNHVATTQDLGPTTEVAIAALDSLAPERPVLLKVDVEGYEFEAIGGAEALLRGPDLQAIVIELNGSGERYGFDEEAIHARLVEAGFAPYRYDGMARALTALAGRDTNQANTIYLRDPAAAAARIKAAPRYQIQGGMV